jgi:hypothetical protein
MKEAYEIAAQELKMWRIATKNITRREKIYPSLDLEKKIPDFPYVLYLEYPHNEAPEGGWRLSVKKGSRDIDFSTLQQYPKRIWIKEGGGIVTVTYSTLGVEQVFKLPEVAGDVHIGVSSGDCASSFQRVKSADEKECYLPQHIEIAITDYLDVPVDAAVFKRVDVLFPNAVFESLFTDERGIVKFNVFRNGTYLIDCGQILYGANIFLEVAVPGGEK